MKFSTPRAGTRARTLRVFALGLLGAMLLGTLAACDSASTSPPTVSIATYFPVTGPDGTVGLSMQRAVDLAIQQNAKLSGGYTLTGVHFDEASDDPGSVASTVTGNTQVMGLVGPLDATAIIRMLPTLSGAGLVTIAPGPLPSSLPTATASTSTSTSTKAPNVLLRLVATDEATGTLAADVALRSTQNHGLGAHAIFVVTDGSVAGNALTGAFLQELHAQGGAVAGQQTITLGSTGNAQAINNAIVDAYPDAVFYGGDVAGAGLLRSTLSFSGAGAMPLLIAGPATADPDWSTLVGDPLAAGNTTGLLAAPNPTTLPGAKTFTSAYVAAYPNTTPAPQAALAYDAAMDQIAAIKGLLTAGKPVTRAAVLAAVAGGKYAGVTGTLAFDAAGNLSKPLGWSLYTVDGKGNWQFQTALNG